MKKILSIVAVLFISTSLFAQSQEVSERSATKTNASINEMVKDVVKIKSPDVFQVYLNERFSKSDMNINKPSTKFKNFIQKTVKSNANYDVKKIALYIRYGEANYESHMEEIQEKEETLNRK